MSLQTRRNTLRDKQRTPLTYRHQSCKPQEDTLCKSHLTVENVPTAHCWHVRLEMAPLTVE